MGNKLSFAIGTIPGIGYWNTYISGELDFGSIPTNGNVFVDWTLDYTTVDPQYWPAWIGSVADATNMTGCKFHLDFLGYSWDVRYPPNVQWGSLNILHDPTGPIPLRVRSVAWNGAEPDFYIDTSVSGDGEVTVNLGTHVENEVGTDRNFVIDIDEPLLYKIVSCTIDGVSTGGITDTRVTFTVIGAWLNRVVVVTTISIIPPAYKITGTLTWSGTTCPGGKLNGLAFVDFGGGGSFKQLLLAAPGSDSDTADDIEAGDPCNVWAVVPNTTCRISSFVVDGVEQIVDLQNWATQYKIFNMPAHDVAVSVVMIGDIHCRPGVPVLPKPTVQVPPKGFQLPPWWPPTEIPSDPQPPGYIPPPDIDFPPEDIPEEPGDSGDEPGSGTTDPNGPERGRDDPERPAFNPKRHPPNFRGVDWTKDTRGLLVRWKDEGGAWSKYHVIDLGLRGDTNLKKKLQAVGSYRIRQYEIVHVDGIPCTIAYLEESLNGLKDVEGQ